MPPVLARVTFFSGSRPGTHVVRSAAGADEADLVGFAESGAHGEKSGSEVFGTLIEPGPETRVITIGELGAAHARGESCLGVCRQAVADVSTTDRYGIRTVRTFVIRVAHQSRD